MRHGYFGQGVSTGFAIDGRQGTTLTLEAGRPYTFSLSELDCGSSFSILSVQSELPSEAVVLEEGVVISGPHPSPSSSSPSAHDPFSACGSQTLTFTPPTSLSGTSVFYGSPSHPYMGGVIKVVEETFCNKYSRLTDKTNLEFMGSVCDVTFALLAKSGPDMIGFFNGQHGPVNYFIDPVEMGRLRTRLVTYFGNAYGCTDEGYPSYQGPSMAEVHSKLPIGKSHFAGFNAALLQAMSFNGVSEEDVTIQKKWLESFFGGKHVGVCNRGDCRTSICDRLSDSLSLSNSLFLQRVVDQAVELARHPLSFMKGHFNGLYNGLKEENVNDFKRGLVSFLGKTTLLTCTDEMFEQDVFLSSPFPSFMSEQEGMLLVDLLLSSLQSNGASLSDLRVVEEAVKREIKNRIHWTWYSHFTPITISLSLSPAGDMLEASSPELKIERDEETRLVTLSLSPGTVYEFSSKDISCSQHTLQLCSDPLSCSLSPVFGGVMVDDYSLSCGGKNPIFFSPLSSQIGQNIVVASRYDPSVYIRLVIVDPDLKPQHSEL